MTGALVDSSIVIDLLRGYPPALTWLRNQTQTIGITRYVWLEVLEGAGNKQEQRTAIKLLQIFQLEATENSDIEWATQAFLKHYLRSNTDPFDCLIASVAFRLQVPLYTRNMKHFRPLLGNLAQPPY